jgi:hypothetical protein
MGNADSVIFWGVNLKIYLNVPWQLDSRRVVEFIRQGSRTTTVQD